MKIQLWNAYASNNSGAYTIVGSFESAEQAQEIAATLNPILTAQTEWMESGSPAGKEPLRDFAKREKVPLEKIFDWPEYHPDRCPRAAVSGDQVVLHHPYTVSLPRFFGHWFYAKGGRVEAEFNHTHHRLAAIFEVGWWQNSSEPGNNQERAGMVLKRLTEAGGPLDRLASKDMSPAWKLRDDPMEPPLVIGACFEDLVAGIAAMQEVFVRFQAWTRLRLMEALSDDDDPLAFLRVSGS